MCRTIDPCGIILAIFTVCLLVYGNFVSNYFCIFYWYYETNLERQAIQGIPLTGTGLFFAFIFNGFCFMSLISHLRAAFADPGIIAKGQTPPEELELSRVKFCRKCDMNWKPERAHHCSECGSCIFKMDHHCPWVNNCVGAGNMKYFLLFVFYTCAAAALSCILLCISFYHLMTAKTKVHTQKPGYAWGFGMCVLAFIEGILFTFFCFELLQEQFESMVDNQSYIDDLKEMYGRPQSFKKNFMLVNGRDYWWWLIPTRPAQKINYLEKLYTIKEMKKLHHFEEDDSDPNNKHFAQVKQRARLEKRIFTGVLASSFLAWGLYLRPLLIELYQ